MQFQDFPLMNKSKRKGKEFVLLERIGVKIVDQPGIGVKLNTN